MAWAHSAGFNEIIFRDSELQLSTHLQDAVHTPVLRVEMVFDRQARPHIILSCKALTGRALGLPSGRRPSYWDLPPELQALLIAQQLKLAVEINALRVEVHLGSWVSSHSIHAHVKLSLQPYFRLRAEHQGLAGWTAEDQKRRAHYISKVHRDRSRYHKEDAAAAHAVVVSDAPRCTADVSAFDSVSFDDDTSGTPCIDITFKNAPVIKNMSHDELRNAMEAIQMLCEHLSIKGAHLLLPAPAVGTAGMAGAHQERAARVVCEAACFLQCLPLDRRRAWYEAWTAGNPSAQAYMEDLSPLTHEEVLQGGSASNAPCEHGQKRTHD